LEVRYASATRLSLLLKLDKYAQYLTTFKIASSIRGNLLNSPRTAELVDRQPTSVKFLITLVLTE
jgi:hypothetical protein